MDGLDDGLDGGIVYCSNNAIGWCVPQIRRQAIKTLPDICKGSKDSFLATRVSDILTQLLLSGEGGCG